MLLGTHKLSSLDQKTCYRNKVPVRIFIIMSILFPLDFIPVVFRFHRDHRMVRKKWKFHIFQRIKKRKFDGFLFAASGSGLRYMSSQCSMT